MHEHMHITDERSNSDMLDEQGQKGSQLEQEDGVLNLKEQKLVSLFRRLSSANQDRVLRCAEVLFQMPDE
ncbi:hypothetical protein JJD71_21515 [Pseudomonas haemolytica]|uniref:DUF3077 domain-containing protein n=2 Tax=Pseudomonas haemolytica TaxID=2600065 RepID=A0ABS1GXE0_9PSED|nr:hypothetical protein [Pseudomonas haemolytica]